MKNSRPTVHGEHTPLACVARRLAGPTLLLAGRQQQHARRVRYPITAFIITILTTSLTAAPKVDFPKIKPVQPNLKAIHAMAASPDGRLLALGRFGRVDLSEIGHKNILQNPLLGHGGAVNALAFSPQGEILYAAGGNAGLEGEIKIWRVKDHKLLRTITGHRDTIYALTVSPDGQRIATGSYDQQIILWNTKDGKPVRTFKGHNGAIFGLAFRRDGRVLASASADATVKLWNTQTGQRLDTLSQPLKAQNAVAFSPDGKTLIAAGGDNRIRAWAISPTAAEGTNPLLHSRFAHDGSLLKLAWSADGKTLLSTANNHSAKLWHADGIRPLRDLGQLTDWPTAAALNNQQAFIGQLDGALLSFPIQK